MTEPIFHEIVSWECPKKEPVKIPELIWMNGWIHEFFFTNLPHGKMGHYSLGGGVHSLEPSG